MSDNYMTPRELQSIADYCEALRPLWEALISGPRGSVSIGHDTAPELTVYDSNGEKLGYITWTEDGPAFFPSASNTEKD